MISSTAEYALRIMIILAEANGEPMTSDRIAKATKVPADYAVKVLQWLGRSKLALGQRGRNGGFRLSCDPRKTTLLDIVNVIDPLERIHACPLGRESHLSKLCPLHHRIDEVLGLLEKSLGTMTLQSVIDDQARGPALCQQTVTVRTSSRVKRKKKRKTGSKRSATSSGSRSRS